MAQTSFALMTNLGRAKEAAALANATTIEITHIAIGDGTTVPSGGETELYNEVARKTISGSGTVVGASHVAYFDAYLAAEDGPYTIREAGLIDSEGDLIAIAHYDPPISKPVPASGQTVEGTVRLEVAFSDIANVTIVVDPATQVPLQRLTVVPWVPVIAVDVADPPVAPALGDTYVIPAGATGAWAGQANKLTERVLSGWAIIDTDNGHAVGLPDGSVMIKVAGIYIPLNASETRRGLAQVATQAEVDAGLDSEKLVTPATLRGLTPQNFGFLKTTFALTPDVNATIANYNGGPGFLNMPGASITDGVVTFGPNSYGLWLVVASVRATTPNARHVFLKVELVLNGTITEVASTLKSTSYNQVIGVTATGLRSFTEGSQLSVRVYQGNGDAAADNYYVRFTGVRLSDLG